jgi:septal ring factor EnvC (AmiA/AmiB activator)
MANDSPLNLNNLRWSLLLLLVACLVSVAAVLYVQQLGRQAELGLKQAQAQQSETTARLARANDDEREIRAKIARYQQIIDQGRTQPERRLEWVETLRSIKTSRRLLGLDYEIAPQRPLDEKRVVSGGHNFLVSPMRLEMALLHENDLLGLLDDLQAQVQALVSVRNCRIERLTQDSSRQNAANLKAQCDIDWITLQEKT